MKTGKLSYRWKETWSNKKKCSSTKYAENDLDWKCKQRGSFKEKEDQKGTSILNQMETGKISSIVNDEREIR